MQQRKKSVQPETVIRDEVRAELQKQGWKVFLITQGRRSHKGFSDLVALKDGMPLFIEVKTSTGRLSIDQVQFANDIADARCCYYVVRSKEEIERVLKVVRNHKMLKEMIEKHERAK